MRRTGQCNRCHKAMRRCRCMSKEQTPITAREFIPKNKSGLYSRNAVETLAEQYAQAKVLEALEREVPKAFERGSVIAYTIGQGNAIALKNIVTSKEYYETEVKLKYE